MEVSFREAAGLSYKISFYQIHGLFVENRHILYIIELLVLKSKNRHSENK